MRKNYEVLEKLILEVYEACRKQKGRLFVVGKAASHIRNKNRIPRNVYAVDLLIQSDFVNDLWAQLSQIPGRGIESIHNNSGMPGLFIRYTDISTLFYNLAEDDRFLYNGLHVNIWILKRYGKRTTANRLLNYMERLWEYKSAPYSAGWTGKEKAIIHLAKLFWNIPGLRSRGGAFLFRKLLKRSNESSSKYRYSFHTPLGEKCFINQGVFQKTEQVCLENGACLWLFPGKSAVMKKYGKISRAVNSLSVYNPNVTFDEYMALLKNTQFRQPHWRKQLYRYWKWRDTRYRKVRRQAALYWNQLSLSYERFKLWDWYFPKKEDIKALYRDGRYDLLDAELDYYYDRLNQYHKLGMGLCFDDEILEMALVRFCMERKGKKAHQILQCTRLEHFEPIGEYEQRYQRDGALDFAQCAGRKARIEARLEVTKAAQRRQEVQQETGKAFSCEIQAGFCRYTFHIWNKSCREERKHEHVTQEIVIGQGACCIDQDVGFVLLTVRVAAELTRDAFWDILVKEGIAALEQVTTTYVSYQTAAELCNKMEMVSLLTDKEFRRK